MKKYLLTALFMVFVLSSMSYAQAPITIDGERDDFYNGLVGPADGHIIIPVDSWIPQASADAPTGNEDISTEIWVAWDETYLYYYEERTDDVLAVSDATQKYLNDCIEVKIDSDPLSPEVTPNDNIRLSVFDTDFAQEPSQVDNLNGDGNLDSASGADWVPTTDDYARAYPETGNRNVHLEFRVPWEMINTSGPVNTVVDGFFGIGFNVADNDEGTRENSLIWGAVVADAIWNTPSDLGTATFLADHKISLVPNSSRDPFTENPNPEWYIPEATALEPVQLTGIAESFELAQNYPNPFNPGTKIAYSLKSPETVSLKVFNSNGELVSTLISNQHQAQGTYEVAWDGSNFASGVYYYQLTSASFTSTRKMVLMK